MTLGDLLDGAVRLFVVNWRALLLTVAVVMVPLQLLLAWLQRDLFETGVLELFRNPAAFDAVAGEVAFSPFTGAEISGLLVTIAISALVLPVITGAVCKVAAGSYLGQPVAWSAALGAAGRLLPSLVGAVILIRVAQFLALLPGAFVGVAAAVTENLSLLLLVLLLLLVGFAGAYALGALYAATIPAIVVEDLGALPAMSRSWRLRSNRFWPTVGAVLVAGLLAAVVGWMISGALSFGGALVGGTFAWLPFAVAAILAQLVELPFLATFSTLLYFDGRIRREGLDLRIMGAEL